MRIFLLFRYDIFVFVGSEKVDNEIESKECLNRAVHIARVP